MNTFVLQYDRQSYRSVTTFILRYEIGDLKNTKIYK